MPPRKIPVTGVGIAATAGSVIAWLAVGVYTNRNICSINRINGPSMTPTFNPDYYTAPLHQDVILVEKWQVKGTVPRMGMRFRRGDVVTFTSPRDPEKSVTKRIVALEGDLVTPLPPSRPHAVQVPAGHAWVEGDAVYKTVDSNTYGPIPLSLVTGRASYVLWPYHRFGPVENGMGKASHRVRKSGGEYRVYRD